MKKGFTLIELLAVIVILAIIAVIAVPIVINIIDDVKINSVKSSATLYLKAVELYKSNAELSKTKINPGTYPITKDGNICIGIINENECNGEVIKIETKGNKPNGGKIIINNDNIKVEYLEIVGNIYYKHNDEYIIEKGKKETIESNESIITLNSSKLPFLTNYRIYGNSIKNVDTIQSVGNLVTDENHKHYGKYEIPIKVTGKNLFTGEIEIGAIDPESGINYKSAWKDYYRSKDFIEIDSSIKNVVFSSNLNSTRIHFCYYDKNYNYLGEYYKTLNKEGERKFYSIPIRENTKYIRISVITRNNPAIIKDVPIQLEIGNVMTDYEPYVEIKLYSIYLDEPLRCVGDVCDYIDYEKGKVIRYIVEKTNDLTKATEEDYDVLSNPLIADIELPKININETISNIFIETNTKPSKVSVNYYK